MKTEIKPIAYIRTDFSSKFGIPRQSGLVDELEARYGQRMVSRLNSFEVVEFIGEDIRQIKK